MKKFPLLVTVLVLFAALSSCEKDTSVEPGNEIAPQLPPAEMFIMPFNGFEDADTSGIKGGQVDTQKSGLPTYRNWFHAASNVVVWNTVLGVTMAVPVASFRASFNANPVHVGNGVFVWTYQYQVAGKTYITELSAEFINSNNDVKWEMRASQVGGFSDVLWYSGIVSADRTKANWNLNHRPQNPQPFLNIAYNYDPVTEAFTIRYTNMIPGDVNQGDYIEYRTSQGADLNRAYDVFRANGNELLEIEWNAPQYKGRVRNPAHYGDTDWHCWDEDQMDTPC